MPSNNLLVLISYKNQSSKQTFTYNIIKKIVALSFHEAREPNPSYNFLQPLPNLICRTDILVGGLNLEFSSSSTREPSLAYTI